MVQIRVCTVCTGDEFALDPLVCLFFLQQKDLVCVLYLYGSPATEDNEPGMFDACSNL